MTQGEKICPIPYTARLNDRLYFSGIDHLAQQLPPIFQELIIVEFDHAAVMLHTSLSFIMLSTNWMCFGFIKCGIWLSAMKINFDKTIKTYKRP